MTESHQVRVGCPVWICPHWKGTVYGRKSPRSAWLNQYSQVFSTVEGNSTFYGLPSPATFERWSQETVDSFRFVLKFPRAITHEKQFVDVGGETDQFLAGLSVLNDAGRLGPSFIQLPPSFGPRQFDKLQRYLLDLPSCFPYAVEFRHHDFFAAPIEDQVNAMLKEMEIDRVIFDSRPLFSSPPDDEIESASQQRKPRSPIRTQVTGRHPIVRLVGRNRIDLAAPWVDEWTAQTKSWLEAGLQPYIFTHAPDDRFAPEFAKMFESRLSDIYGQLNPGSLRQDVRQVQRSLF